MVQAAGPVSHLHCELFTLKVITCHRHFSPPEDGDGSSLRNVVFLTHLNVGHVRNIVQIYTVEFVYMHLHNERI
jgi:hypothetical protein